MGHPSGGGAMSATNYARNEKVAREVAAVDPSDPFAFGRMMCHLRSGAETNQKKLQDHIKRGTEAAAIRRRQIARDAEPRIAALLRELGFKKQRTHRPRRHSPVPA